MKIIQVEHLSVSYGKVKALEDVSFDVEQGSFLSVIGPNGGGKTTLIKVLLGLIKPGEGTLKINSEKPVGYVPQFNSFERRFPITVCRVVLMGSLSGKSPLFHRYSPEDKARSHELMALLGIEALHDRQISQLSGGQMQKVLLARALMTDPDILILDEPTSSIDAESRTEIYGILNRLKGEKTIILISHDMGSVSSYIDAIACLNVTMEFHEDGKITEASLNHIYGCPVDLIAHGVPHRVFPEHPLGGHSHD
ncbi:MAG: ABC transporter [delta proteobacterium ML8_F1]|nr:MAG: ABC transporter [delta proteobacterium ML8_F1]